MHEDDSKHSQGTSHVGKGKQVAHADQAQTRILPVPDPRLSRSLEYGIAILECYSSERQELGIAELADIVGISRSTTHRYAITLMELGFLEQDAKRKYPDGWKSPRPYMRIVSQPSSSPGKASTAR